MDLLIKMASTGDSITLRNLSLKISLEKLKIILSEKLKIENKKIVLISKKGKKLRKEKELIFELEKDFLGETIDRENSYDKKINVIFLYIKNLKIEKNEKIENFSILEKKIKMDNFLNFTKNENLENNLEKKILKKFSNFQKKEILNPLADENYDIEKVAHILEIAPNIFETENNFFLLYKKIKNLLKKFSLSISNYKKMIIKCSNQVTGNELLFVNLVNFYNLIKKKKIETFKKFSLQKNINKNTIKKFEESLLILKKIELHPLLQKNGNKNLIDIYFSEEKMEKWKKNCFSFEKNLEKNLEKKIENLKKIKKDIIFQNNKVKEFVKIWIDFENLLEKKMRNLQNMLEILFNEFFEDFLELRKNLVSVIENEKNINNYLIFLSNYKKYEKKLEIYKKKFSESETNFLSFQNELQKLIKKYYENSEMLKKNEKLVFLLSENLEKLKKNYKEIYKKDLKKLEGDFSNLLKPSLLPQGYKDLLLEITRRRNCYKKLNKIVENVMEISENENSKRKIFLGKYGNILPENFIRIIPHLKENLKCKFFLNLEEFEKLPKIEFEEKIEKIENLGNLGNLENEDFVVFEKNKEIENLKGELNFLKKLISGSFENEKKIGFEILENFGEKKNEVKNFLKRFLISNTKFCVDKMNRNFGEKILDFEKKLKKKDEKILELEKKINFENLEKKKNFENLKIFEEQKKIDFKNFENEIFDLKKEIKNLEKKNEFENEKNKTEILSLKFIIENQKINLFENSKKIKNFENLKNIKKDFLLIKINDFKKKNNNLKIEINNNFLYYIKNINTIKNFLKEKIEKNFKEKNIQNLEKIEKNKNSENLENFKNEEIELLEKRIYKYEELLDNLENDMTILNSEKKNLKNENEKFVKKIKILENENLEILENMKKNISEKNNNDLIKKIKSLEIENTNLIKKKLNPKKFILQNQKIFLKKKKEEKKKILEKNQKIPNPEILEKNQKIPNPEILGKNQKIQNSEILGKNQKIPNPEILGKNQKIPNPEILVKNVKIQNPEISLNLLPEKNEYKIFIPFTEGIYCNFTTKIEKKKKSVLNLNSFCPIFSKILKVNSFIVICKVKISQKKNIFVFNKNYEVDFYDCVELKGIYSFDIENFEIYNLKNSY